jgi:hypothetical protein
MIVLIILATLVALAVMRSMEPPARPVEDRPITLTRLRVLNWTIGFLLIVLVAFYVASIFGAVGFLALR